MQLRTDIPANCASSSSLSIESFDSAADDMARWPMMTMQSRTDIPGSVAYLSSMTTENFDSTDDDLDKWPLNYGILCICGTSMLLWLAIFVLSRLVFMAF